MSFTPSQYSSATYSLTGGASPYSLSSAAGTPDPTAAPAPENPEVDPAVAAAQSKTDMYTSLAQSIGLMGSGIISTVGASSLQKSQQKHEASMLKRQGKLAVLQGSASAAQASAARASAALAGQGTKKTIYIVSGLLIGLTVIAGTVMFLRQPRDSEDT